MKKYLKYFYSIITALFMILTIFEIYFYMVSESNYLGLFYLIFNLYIMFLLFTIFYNYNKSNKKIRISKNIMVIIIGIISSFILSSILSHIFSYNDNSQIYSDKIFVISKIIKPIIYTFLGIVSFIEIKLTKKFKS